MTDITDRSLTIILDWSNRCVRICGMIQTQAEADELIKFVEFIQSENFFRDKGAAQQ